MTEQEIHSRIRRHNFEQALVGAGLACGAGALWVASFWLWRFFAFIWLKLLRFHDPWQLSLYAAIALTAVLAIEGIRHTRQLFDLMAYHESIYYRGILPNYEKSVGGVYIIPYFNFPLHVAYLISQLLFAAPRTSVLSLRAFRALVGGKGDAAAAATRVYNELHAARGWVCVSTLRDHGAALCLLDKLGLIWTDVERGEAQVRTPPVK